MKTYGEIFKTKFLACLLGPLAIIPAAILLSLVFKLIDPTTNQDQMGAIGLFIAFGLIIAYPATLLLGLPLSIVLEKFEQLNLLNLLLIVVLLVGCYVLYIGHSFLEFLFILYFSFSVTVCSWYFHRVFE